MNLDPFDFDDLTLVGWAWRVAFLAAAVSVALLDLLVWRP